MTIKVNPKIIFFYLLRITSSLLILNIISIIYRINFLPADVLTQPGQLRVVDQYIFLVVKYFDFNEEVNFPTFYSTILLFVCAILLMLIGWKQKSVKNMSPFWITLSLIFVFLSLDEFIQLHDVLTWPIRYLLNSSGFFYFAWIIPYGILLILLTLYSYKFLIRLPKKILRLFLIAGAIYIFGALIIEMPQGWLLEKYGYTNTYFIISYTIEEFLEMLGLNIFIYSLTVYKSFSIKIN